MDLDIKTRLTDLLPESDHCRTTGCRISTEQVHLNSTDRGQVQATSAPTNSSTDVAGHGHQRDQPAKQQRCQSRRAPHHRRIFGPTDDRNSRPTRAWNATASDEEREAVYGNIGERWRNLRRRRWRLQHAVGPGNGRADASARYEADTQAAGDPRYGRGADSLQAGTANNGSPAVKGDPRTINRQRAFPPTDSRTAGANSTPPFRRETRPGTDRYRTKLSTDPPPLRPI